MGIVTKDDQALVSLIQQDNHHAFMQLYNRYSGLLYVYATRITRNDEAAEDLVQDVFASLWDKRHTLELKSDLASYLYSAVRYRFFDLVDKRKVRSDYFDRLTHFAETASPQTDQHLLEKELIGLVERAIASLPDRMRRIFELSRKEHLTNKEIAEMLRLSEKTVKNNLSLAVKNLKKKLGPYIVFLLLLQ